MPSFARYPRPDPEYQKNQHYHQVRLAREIVSYFPKVKNLLDNFKDYEKKPYTDTKNKIFCDCIEWIREYCSLLEMPIEKMHVDGHLAQSDIFQSIKMLDDAWTMFCAEIPKKHEFKKRISNLDYDTSSSAFEEITLVYDLRRRIGSGTVEYEPKTSHGKFSDVSVIIDSQKIFLEISSIAKSMASGRFQKIFDRFAKFLYKNVKPEKQKMSLWLDTTKFALARTNIDEEKSFSLLQKWTEKLCLSELVGFVGAFHIVDYRSHGGIDKYDNYLLSDYPHHGIDVQELLKNQPTFKHWAKKITISDMVDSPITSFAYESIDNSPSVIIHEDSSFSTNPALLQNSALSDIQVGLMQHESFLRQIKRKIRSKIREKQFEDGCPIIFIIKCSLWSNDFENSSDDFSKIKVQVENVIKQHSFISGVLVYNTVYTHGRFIYNPGADEKTKLSDSTISDLFSMPTRPTL